MTAIVEAPTESEVLGSTTPRIWTRPLITGAPGECGCGCSLSRETTEGFEVEVFARDVLHRPLDPWERWLVIHGLELLPNGWPRFRQLVILVARQNGKTELLVILSIYWMWKRRVGMVLGTSTKLDYSRESWLKVIKLIRRTPALAPDISARGAVRSANGEQEVCTPWDSRYKIAAANEEGGRSLTVDRLVEDEIRQHFNYSAHAAAENTMNAVPDAQAWAISNEGDDRSVVLHDLYDAAFLFITTGEGDERLGLFAYSAPPGCDLEDEHATAQANPNLGRRIFWANLIGKARRAKLAGGEQEAKYRTEVLCQRVQSMTAKAISLDTWAATALDVRPDGDPVFFVTIAKDMAAATISVAATHEGAPHVELADHRDGTGHLTGRLRELARRYPGAKFAAWRAGPVKAWVPVLAEPYVDDETDELMPGFELLLLPSTDEAAACAHLQKLADNLAFTHSPDPVVVESLKGAEKRDLEGNAWAWNWYTSTGDLAPISGHTGALWMLAKFVPALPMIF
jgi:hypothetical protein